MKNITKFCIYACVLLFFSGLFAQPTPPNGKKWEKIDAVSDEFNGSSLNGNKWAINDPQWEGRKPARFESSSVSVSGGNLRVTASKKNNPFGGWTHNGGLVRSKTRHLYGYYETRMKANKTFMSSTFWLINKKNEFSGCDARVTELDITENVGINSGGQSWINRNIVTLNANTHSRGTSCNSTPTGSQGNKSDIGEPAYAGYHTYGVWWKNARELLFYLDGRFVFRITPPANFNLPMYLRMVVETYNWNPPRDGRDGMNDSFANRTTYYDWVRCYKLVDGPADPTPTPTPNTGTVTIKGQSINKYISSENGNGPMRANRSTAREWERFTVVSSANGTVAIKGNNGKFVSSENGSKPMTCIRNSVQAWERFTLVSQGGNVYALRGNNGKYVSHENGADAGITCNRNAIGAWEKFVIEGLSNKSLVVDTVVEQKASIYPNPASSNQDVFIDLQLQKAANASIHVMDIQGRLIINKYLGLLSAGQTTIPLGDLKSSLSNKGLYLVKVVMGDQEVHAKLMLE